MCVSRVNGKCDRGNTIETQAVCNNRKNLFFKCPCIQQYGINWKLLDANIDKAHEKYAKFEFQDYASNDATADATSCLILAAFISTPEESKPKIWMHIKLV